MTLAAKEDQACRIQELEAALSEEQTHCRNYRAALREIKKLIEKNTPDDVNPSDAWWGAWDIARAALKERLGHRERRGGR